MAAHTYWRGLAVLALGVLCVFVPALAHACPLKLAVTPAFMRAIAPNNDVAAQTLTLQGAVGCAITITQTGPAQAVQAVLDGEATAAGIWSPPKDVTRNVTGGNIFGLTSTAVGSQTLQAIVHSDNPVRGMSDGHIRAILNGTLKDWSELTGHSAAIIVIDGDQTGEIGTLLQKTYLNGFVPAASVRTTANLAQAARALTQTDNGISFFSGPLPQGKIAALTITPPVSQTLYIVTSGAPDTDMKKLIDALLARRLQ